MEAMWTSMTKTRLGQVSPRAALALMALLVGAVGCEDQPDGSGTGEAYRGPVESADDPALVELSEQIGEQVEQSVELVGDPALAQSLLVQAGGADGLGPVAATLGLQGCFAEQADPTVFQYTDYEQPTYGVAFPVLCGSHGEAFGSVDVMLAGGHSWVSGSTVHGEETEVPTLRHYELLSDGQVVTSEHAFDLGEGAIACEPQSDELGCVSGGLSWSWCSACMQVAGAVVNGGCKFGGKALCLKTAVGMPVCLTLRHILCKKLKQGTAGHQSSLCKSVKACH